MNLILFQFIQKQAKRPILGHFELLFDFIEFYFIEKKPRTLQGIFYCFFSGFGPRLKVIKPFKKLRSNWSPHSL